MKLFVPFLSAMLTLGVLPLNSHAQAPSLSPSAGAANPSDLSQYTTADALWLHIQDLKKGPPMRPATAAEYRAAMMVMVPLIYDGATEFVKRYPGDPRKWDARLLQIEMENTLNQMSGRDESASTARQLQDLSKQNDASSSVRGQARYELLALSLHAYLQGNTTITSASILAQLEQFTADFPTYPSLDVLKYKVAESLGSSDPAASGTLLKELAASGEGRVADQARKELATRERLKSPLDLHFTAVDGSQVDLSTMRGKVVLVDFWATWCGPCKAELPNVLSAYQKLHDKGFEIVGISLDQDRDSLLKYTAQKGMTWPQYFDGKGWNNGISSEFGIQSIPTMWLVNKKGFVVTTNGRADLEGQVEQLLAE